MLVPWCLADGEGTEDGDLGSNGTPAAVDDVSVPQSYGAKQVYEYVPVIVKMWLGDKGDVFWRIRGGIVVALHNVVMVNVHGNDGHGGVDSSYMAIYEYDGSGPAVAFADRDALGAPVEEVEGQITERAVVFVSSYGKNVAIHPSIPQCANLLFGVVHMCETPQALSYMTAALGRYSVADVKRHADASLACVSGALQRDVESDAGRKRQHDTPVVYSRVFPRSVGASTRVKPRCRSAAARFAGNPSRCFDLVWTNIATLERFMERHLWHTPVGETRTFLCQIGKCAVGPFIYGDEDGKEAMELGDVDFHGNMQGLSFRFGAPDVSASRVLGSERVHVVRDMLEQLVCCGIHRGRQPLGWCGLERILEYRTSQDAFVRDKHPSSLQDVLHRAKVAISESVDGVEGGQDGRDDLIDQLRVLEDSICSSDRARGMGTANSISKATPKSDASASIPVSAYDGAPPAVGIFMMGTVPHVTVDVTFAGHGGDEERLSMLVPTRSLALMREVMMRASLLDGDDEQDDIENEQGEDSLLRVASDRDRLFPSGMRMAVDLFSIIPLEAVMDETLAAVTSESVWLDAKAVANDLETMPGDCVRRWLRSGKMNVEQCICEDLAWSDVRDVVNKELARTDVPYSCVSGSFLRLCGGYFLPIAHAIVPHVSGVQEMAAAMLQWASTSPDGSPAPSCGSRRIVTM